MSEPALRTRRVLLQSGRSTWRHLLRPAASGTTWCKGSGRVTGTSLCRVRPASARRQQQRGRGARQAQQHAAKRAPGAQSGEEPSAARAACDGCDPRETRSPPCSGTGQERWFGNPKRVRLKLMGTVTPTPGCPVWNTFSICQENK